ncbi:hypothetical protein [Martelella soudanensis]|uniref:hypothetical protein n=1 Tax=unclassified Martelella TaxID=2629616 RepID=UPI0015E0446B|nr:MULTISPECIES: hypothetical protein [unclassified Martelella]
MARYITSLLLGGLVLFLPAAASADDNRLVEARGQGYSASFTPSASPADEPSTTSLLWDADLQMALENDAPALTVRFRYEIEDWRYLLPTFGPGTVQAWSPGDATGTALPEEAPRIQPLDVKLMFRFYAPGQNAYVGVSQEIATPGAPGEWAESAPTRPDWGQTFIWLSGINKDAWLAPDTARSVWQGELRPEGVTILETAWSADELMAFLAENNMRNRAVAAAEAVNRLLDGVARSFGYEVDAMREDPEKYLEPAFRRGVPIALLRKLERLKHLPNGLKQGDDAAYEQARSEADAIMAAMERDRESHAGQGWQKPSGGEQNNE